MAPDLNSVPISPRPPNERSSRSSSRPTSQLLSPISPNILPSNQAALNQPTMPVPTGTGVGGVVDTGPGPIRYPRPLTAADLQQKMEQEQEAVVNRLSRELSILRAAQNASVVSNVSSSNSAGLPDSGDHNANHMLSGPSHPQPSSRRHHRSSSSTSTRSITAGTAASGSTAGWTTTGIAGSVSGAIPSSTSRTNISRQNSMSISRQNSTTSSRRSGASSPALTSSSYPHNSDYFPSLYQPRPSPREIPMPNPQQAGTHLDPQAQATTTVPTTGRYEETAYHRNELDAVKRENEILKRRIRELERTIRSRRQSDASRTRSESVSTTASVNVPVSSGAGRGRDQEKEGEDEPVRVGESARSGGLR